MYNAVFLKIGGIPGKNKGMLNLSHKPQVFFFANGTAGQHEGEAFLEHLGPG